MKQQILRFYFFGKDFGASIVVFLVALPLCMGIAIASGVPTAAGLILGIIDGIVVALLSGVPLLVSGLAVRLTVLVGDIVQQHGLSMLGILVLFAGMLQLLAGLFNLGQWFRAIFSISNSRNVSGYRHVDLRIAISHHGGRCATGERNSESVVDSGVDLNAMFPPDDTSHHMAAMMELRRL